MTAREIKEKYKMHVRGNYSISEVSTIRKIATTICDDYPLWSDDIEECVRYYEFLVDTTAELEYIVSKLKGEKDRCKSLWRKLDYCYGFLEELMINDWSDFKFFNLKEDFKVEEL